MSEDRMTWSIRNVDWIFNNIKAEDLRRIRFLLEGRVMKDSRATKEIEFMLKDLKYPMHFTDENGEIDPESPYSFSVDQQETEDLMLAQEYGHDYLNRWRIALKRGEPISEVDLEVEVEVAEGEEVSTNTVFSQGADLDGFCGILHDPGTRVEFRVVPMPFMVLFGAQVREGEPRCNLIALEYDFGVTALNEEPQPKINWKDDCDDWLAVMQAYVADVVPNVK